MTYRPRIIPVLLLRGGALVKTIQFGRSVYIGDAMNAVKIFNDLEADELVFLDIDASKENRCIPVDFIREVGEEANMPFAVGGGISTLEQIRERIAAGAEKVIINYAAFKDPGFIRRASDMFGTSTIAVQMDVKRHWLKGQETYILNGTVSAGYRPLEFAQLMQEKGAGEIIVQSIDKDGLRQGYDIELIRKISENVAIPVTALGGAGSMDDMKALYDQVPVNGLAAGSMFVFQGKRNGVLINYPDTETKMKLFSTL